MRLRTPRNNLKKDKYKKPKQSKQQHSFNFKNKENIPPLDIPHSKQQITIDSNFIISFLQLLLQHGLITKEEIETKVLNPDNPLKYLDYKLENNQVLDKGSLRALWLRQMAVGTLYCCLCGNPITSTTGHLRLTAEHTYPKSKGGKTNSTNLLPAHAVCNSLKTNILPQVWEKVGPAILHSRGIDIDYSKVPYDYMQYLKQRQR